MRQVKYDTGEIRSALGVIYSSYDELFEAEKKITDYMTEHKAEVVDMTVGELTRVSGASDVTVSRFYRWCGFRGFHNLKLTLIREMLEEEQTDKNVSDNIDCGDLRQSLWNILTSKMAELTETVNMMGPANLEHIPDRLKHARMVWPTATGNTTPVVLDGAFKLNQLGIPVVAGNIWETQTAYTLSPEHKGVVMIISDSGSSERPQALVEGAKSDGYTVILITNNGNLPLAGICDYKIVTTTREKLLTEEFWLSRVTATAIIEVPYLLLQVGMEDSVERIRRHEEATSPDKK